MSAAWWARLFERERTLISMRLDDMLLVHPDMVVEACSGCGERVGVYPSGQAVIARYRRVKILCHVCAPVDLVGSQLAPGALAEVGQSIWKV
jgi:hypothetical protein